MMFATKMIGVRNCLLALLTPMVLIMALPEERARPAPRQGMAHISPGLYGRPSIWRDRTTGCDYFDVGRGELVARRDWNGYPVCWLPE